MQDPRSESAERYTAFRGTRLIGRGSLEAVLRLVKAEIDASGYVGLLIFEDTTGRQVEFDFSGEIEAVLARSIPQTAKVGPGRPRLGVVSREVSLLPRHWDWLEQDPQGISAALRRLVDEARKRDGGQLERQQERDAASRFMWAMAGNLPNFEEASRALFAGDRSQFFGYQRDWPVDIVAHLEGLTAKYFDAQR